MSDSIVRDVLIIGGGAAGLTAATALARFLRSVEVIDAGRPRNASSPGVHNLLGHDGISPAALLASGRAEVERFGGTVTNGLAVSASHDDGTFVVTLADGGQRRARRLIVTTGTHDDLPDIPGLADRWGRDVVHCPYCHGYEVRGESIGVLATGPAAVHQAQLFAELSDDVVVLAHTAPSFDADQRAVLAALDVDVVDGRVAEIVVRDDRIHGVRFADGRTVERQVLVVASSTDSTSAVLDDLGVHRADDGFGGYAHEATGATNVAGVWVAGNVAEPMATVVLASAAGMTAASMVNMDLITEKVVARRR